MVRDLRTTAPDERPGYASVRPGRRPDGRARVLDSEAARHLNPLDEDMLMTFLATWVLITLASTVSLGAFLAFDECRARALRVRAARAGQVIRVEAEQVASRAAPQPARE